MAQRTPQAQKKLYLFYFIIISLVVVLIGGISVGSYYYDYWSTTRLIKKYLIQDNKQLAKPVAPHINPLDPVVGNKNAKVLVYEYADFTCPRCASIQPEIKDLENFYGSRIGIVFKGIPITRHPERNNALHAAYCAAEQGAFPEYKNALFENQTTLSAQLYPVLARELGINVTLFTECYESQKYQSLISKNVDQALQVGVTSTPTIFVNTVKEDFAFSFVNLKGIVNAQLNQ